MTEDSYKAVVSTAEKKIGELGVVVHIFDPSTPEAEAGVQGQLVQHSETMLRERKREKGGKKRERRGGREKEREKEGKRGREKEERGRGKEEIGGYKVDKKKVVKISYK
jgi:hypothetical protein